MAWPGDARQGIDGERPADTEVRVLGAHGCYSQLLGKSGLVLAVRGVAWPRGAPHGSAWKVVGRVAHTQVRVLGAHVHGPSWLGLAWHGMTWHGMTWGST
jgi:hypothetical protein